MKEELLGLSEISSTILKCGDCGTPLVDLVITETNESRQERGKKPLRSKFQVYNCYRCGSESFESQVLEGSVIAGPLKDSYEIDIEDSNIEDDGVIFNKMRVRSRK